jgi:ATP-dependent DNA ligase
MFNIEFKKAHSYQNSFSKCLIEEKIDGIRLILTHGMALTRGGNNWWNKLPVHIQALASDIPVDGELHWPGHTSTDVTTALKNKSPELQFTGFYLPLFSGKPLEHRSRIKAMGLQVPALFGPESYITAPSIQVLKETAHQRKLEGWVLKEESSSAWWKIKLEETYDLIVTGFNLSTEGRHEGMLKSLKCSAYIGDTLVEVANVSGMNDETRYAFDEDADVGRVVEVKANLVAARGRLRHPCFVRWRDDKPAKSCVLNAA